MTGWPTCPVRGGNLPAARTEAPGRALAVDAELRRRAVDRVRLDLGHVVADVVDLAHAGRASQDPGEDVPDPVGDHLAVGEGIVHGGAHGAVIASGRGPTGRAR